MTTAPNILIQQALEAIFDSKVNALPPTSKFDEPTVRVTRTVIEPAQFQALAHYCQYLGQYPTLVRGGEYVTVVFTC